MTTEEANAKAARRKSVITAVGGDREDTFSALGLDRSVEMRNTLVKGFFDRKRKQTIDRDAK